MSCWTGDIYYPDLTKEQNAYLEELRDSFTANGCSLTPKQEAFLDSLVTTLWVETPEGVFPLQVWDGNETSDLKVRVG